MHFTMYDLNARLGGLPRHSQCLQRHLQFSLLKSIKMWIIWFHRTMLFAQCACTRVCMEIKIKVFVMKIERAIKFISETKWNEIKSTKANIRIPNKKKYGQAFTYEWKSNLHFAECAGARNDKMYFFHLKYLIVGRRQQKHAPKQIRISLSHSFLIISWLFDTIPLWFTSPEYSTFYHSNRPENRSIFKSTTNKIMLFLSDETNYNNI